MAITTGAPRAAKPPSAGARRSRRTGAGTPPGAYTTGVAPGALPLAGHAAALWRRPLEFFDSLRQYGDLVEIRMGRSKAYVPCHPLLLQEILFEPRTYDKGGPIFEKARVLVGNGLVSSDFEVHKVQRRLVQPAFHALRLPGYSVLMRQEVENELATWRPGEVFDLRDSMHSLTLRIASRTLYATPVGAQSTPEVLHCMPIIMRGVYTRTVSPVPFLEKLPTRENRRYKDAYTRMHKVIDRMIGEYRASGEDHGDLLSILINARDEETGASLSDKEINDQVMTLLTGGTETTGNGIASLFQILADYPEVERRLRQEADEVLAGRPPTYEDLPRLEYHGRVLAETLRLRPPVWITTRATTRDTELAGTRLPKGTTVMLSPYIMHLNPELFPDPKRFDPDRWLPERAGEIPRGAYVPFGSGNRKCIGDRFGLAELTLALATIVSRWTLEILPAKRPYRVPEATLGTGPLLAIARPRHPRTVSAAGGSHETTTPAEPHSQQAAQAHAEGNSPHNAPGCPFMHDGAPGAR